MEKNIINISVLILIITLLFVLIAYILESHKYQKSDFAKHNSKKFFYLLFNKGSMGEYRTSLYIEKAGIYHKTIYNCYVYNYKNQTTEIDMIVLSEKGIFVIENKNYSGLVCGNDRSKNWCQTLGGKKYYFYNPVKQNKSHIKNLNRILHQDTENYRSVVTFNNAVLKNISLTENHTYVMNSRKLRTFFRKQTLKKKIYSRDTIRVLYNMLIPYTRVSRTVRREHVQRIQKEYGKQ